MKVPIFNAPSGYVMDQLCPVCCEYLLADQNLALVRDGHGQVELVHQDCLDEFQPEDHA